ncbi:glycosyltransferase [Actinomadura madurae]|uniref:glycosyltransferase n=1 Tax=Actinomadura madurae TaxID=1993 RepID=UPI00355884D1
MVTVGRLARQKGLPTLLDAARGWTGRTPPPLVAIAGDGPLEDELRARVEAEDLPVRLLGRRSDVAALLAACDVAVVPSVWEGQPLIVQEILRAGRPLVATRVGGIPGMLGAAERGGEEPLLQGPESEAALLVPPNDAEALGRAVDRVLDDPSLAARLASAAAQRSALLPDEDDAADQLAALYLELVGSRR